jgi:hypothetical protein
VPTTSSEKPFDVFLSYHSGDAEWVGTLRSNLAARGIRVWLDSEQIRPGDQFPGALARAIGSVRSVVLVLSPGSAASTWVEEEYNLALARRCHIVAVLIDEVEPPGFLAGRTWVDFRDPAEFASSLDQLVFGITGSQPAQVAASPPPFRDAGAPASTDEADVLKRLLDRRRRDVRRLWYARVASGLIGLAMGAGFLVLAADATWPARLAIAGFTPAILLLASWGLTTTSLTRLDAKVEQFEVLHDGLEACRARSHPGCKKLRQHFWDMMTNIAADAGVRAV